MGLSLYCDKTVSPIPTVYFCNETKCAIWTMDYHDRSLVSLLTIGRAVLFTHRLLCFSYCLVSPEFLGETQLQCFTSTFLHWHSYSRMFWAFCLTCVVYFLLIVGGLDHKNSVACLIKQVYTTGYMLILQNPI